MSEYKIARAFQGAGIIDVVDIYTDDEDIKGEIAQYMPRMGQSVALIAREIGDQAFCNILVDPAWKEGQELQKRAFHVEGEILVVADIAIIQTANLVLEKIEIGTITNGRPKHRGRLYWRKLSAAGEEKARQAFHGDAIIADWKWKP